MCGVSFHMIPAVYREFFHLHAEVRRSKSPLISIVFLSLDLSSDLFPVGELGKAPAPVPSLTPCLFFLAGKSSLELSQEFVSLNKEREDSAGRRGLHSHPLIPLFPVWYLSILEVLGVCPAVSHKDLCSDVYVGLGDQ